MITKRIAAFVIALAALLFTPRAFATSCEVQLKSSSDRADVIFVGTVAAETPMAGGMGIFRVRVERVFKGSVPATQRPLREEVHPDADEQHQQREQREDARDHEARQPEDQGELRPAISVDAAIELASDRELRREDAQ